MNKNPAELLDEKVKLDNAEAHLAVILGNIRIANEQLEEVFKQKELVSVGIKKTTDGLLLANEKIQELFAQETEIRRDLANREEQLNTKERRLSENEQKFDAFFNKRNKEILEEEHFLEDKIRNNKESLKSTEILLEKETEKLVKLSNSIDKKKEELSITELSLRDKTNILSELQEKYEEKEKEYNTEFKKCQTKLSLIVEEININREKVKNPIEALDKREYEVNKKEKNFQIRYLRLKKYMKKYFPEQELIL